jgi:hypothetical protein
MDRLLLYLRLMDRLLLYLRLMDRLLLMHLLLLHLLLGLVFHLLLSQLLLLQVFLLQIFLLKVLLLLIFLLFQLALARLLLLHSLLVDLLFLLQQLLLPNLLRRLPCSARIRLRRALIGRRQHGAAALRRLPAGRQAIRTPGRELLRAWEPRLGQSLSRLNGNLQLSWLYGGWYFCVGRRV